jgi:hypothetical protein
MKGFADDDNDEESVDAHPQGRLGSNPARGACGCVRKEYEDAVASRVLPVINRKGDLKMDDNDGEFEHLPRPLWLRNDDKGKDLLCLFSWRAPIDCWTDLDCHLFYKEEGGYTQDQMQPRAFENHGNDA